MMASSKRLLPAILLLLLVMASEMGTTMVAEARLCESQSHKFVGPCVRQANCASVCHTEGFVGGVCRGHVFDRMCFCTKNC